MPVAMSVVSTVRCRMVALELAEERHKPQSKHVKRGEKGRNQTDKPINPTTLRT